MSAVTTQATSRNKGSSSETQPWRCFAAGIWQRKIDVRDFIIKNYKPYYGDESFLARATERTTVLWGRVLELMKLERASKGGVLDVDVSTPSGIAAHKPGYIDAGQIGAGQLGGGLEIIVGLQTDAPLKRAIMPNGGYRMVESGLKAYGRVVDPKVTEIFTKYRKTHNDGVFDVYTPEIMRARRSHIVTGLPDAYGRGRIIGDYRRVALYGVDRLIEDKLDQKASYDDVHSTEAVVRAREELSEQIRALKELKAMAAGYGFDISLPARDGREAVQWLYFGYLAAVKEQNGAAMSIGRISTFLDVYLERDLAEGALSETQAQALMDDLVIKLRMVRFLRTPEYDALFSGDPTWVTEAIGGMALDGRPLVTKSSYRILHTLTTLGPAPEPNLTILWSKQLPPAFKKYAAKVSVTTSSIQYENDDLMRKYWGDDYGIACCVSAMRIGKQMQFFGARVNLAKALLYAINGGRDEVSGDQVFTPTPAITDDVLDYDKVMAAFDLTMNQLAKVYVNALNCIHYMHDKYSYERIEFALHDRDILRTLACGVAGLSVVADSLSAIKHAKVKVLRNDAGLAVDYQIDGDFPKYGNHDDRVDQIAVKVVEAFMEKIRRHPAYRDATHTQSVLTITSNVVYGVATGNTPDGRKAGEPFAPGANPMHGRDTLGFAASALSVAKIPYDASQDGISYTCSMVPAALGSTLDGQAANLVGALEGYFDAGGHHINVNVLNKQTLQDAMDHPEKYPQLTIRVSGYAVNFIKLTRQQQQDVINRTFHSCM